MTRLAVNVFQKRHQLFTKHFVIVGAAKPAAVAKIDKLDAAVGTFVLPKEPLIGLSRDFGFADFRLLRLLHVFLSAVFAEVKLLELALAQHFGDVQRGGIGALHALVHVENS